MTHTRLLGVDEKVFAAWAVSTRVVGLDLNIVLGVGCHPLQPGVVLPAGRHYPEGLVLGFIAPPVLHLGHTKTGHTYFTTVQNQVRMSLCTWP